MRFFENKPTRTTSKNLTDGKFFKNIFHKNMRLRVKTFVLFNPIWITIWANVAHPFTLYQGQIFVYFLKLQKMRFFLAFLLFLTIQAKSRKKAPKPTYQFWCQGTVNKAALYRNYCLIILENSRNCFRKYFRKFFTKIF